ncbi:hypothetical protein F8388_008337 [Cannabis sativa]|nr:hypothetical protein F8388_008337 [Cannabis sativa]
MAFSQNYLGFIIAFVTNYFVLVTFAGNFNQDFDITWGDGRGKIINNGEILTLSLDKASGSGFQSKSQYLFGKIDMQIKLVPGNSAGTVTAYYLRSEGSSWDEIDFEFLGNVSDGTPIREFKNKESIGVPYPKNQPMKIYSSLWNAEEWATRGGLVKTDWTQAPFTASYKKFNDDQACAWSSSSSLSSPSSCSNTTNSVLVSQELDTTSQERLKWNLDVTWGEGRCNIINGGNVMAVSLDKVSGSGFESKNEYLFTKIEMQIKLVPGNSAGTVTAFYLSSKGDQHDEIDFEFLGNVSGDPYTLHTNVFCKGEGKREQQFRLWFMVDGEPIREFKNLEGVGIPYPKSQPMKLYSSLWNADDWATRGGLVKTDWSKAPFTAHFKNFKAQNGCSWSNGGSCKTLFSSFSNNHRLWDKLDHKDQEKMRQIQKDNMVYDYCTDYKRFPQGPPKE